MAIDWDALVLAPLHALLGESTIYLPAGGVPFVMTDAVFDRGYVQVGADAAGVAVTAWITTLGVRLASCPAGFTPSAADRVSLRGATWQVNDVQPDGKGDVVLVLGVVAP